MDDDLFTYEVEIANIPCDLRVDDDSEHEASDMGFDPSDIAFTEWLGSKGDDEVELTDEEFFDNEDEIDEVFRIDTNIFDYETPICSAFNEFNYLLIKDWDLLHEDLEHIDDLDIEEMDINWQIAMIAIRMKKFYKKTGRRVLMMEKALGPQEPKPSVSDDRSSEYSTCQSNDSAGSIGTSSEHSFDPESEISRVPKEVYVSKPITTNEQGVSVPKSKEVEPSCVSYIKTPMQPIKDQETPKVNRKNWNAIKERELGEVYSFKKKKCFVCGSLSHLIKDCDYYEKKMEHPTQEQDNREIYAVSWRTSSPHIRYFKVTNSAGTSQTPTANASEEKDKDAELIVVSSAVKNTAEKVEPMKSSTTSKKE
ncbi:hypothetical protein Tco_0853311 [Tanacetum coccineum]